VNPLPAKGTHLLEVRALKVAYGGINAVRGIDLTVANGEMVALIGANGAGKTTTLKAICGLLRHSGTVHLRGEDVSNFPAHRLVERGLALVPEGRGVFGRLTVRENLQMGAYIRRDKAEIAADLERIYALFPRLAERRNQTGGTLSGGEQQMLAIGRALMSSPKLLLLDEPSMGLAPMLIQQIFNIITEISKQGTTILVVEQNAQQALSRADRAYVMETGRIVKQGTGKDLLTDPAVKEAYLGVA
jgi:branched-chain amino acid transport system ATP-binding protein